MKKTSIVLSCVVCLLLCGRASAQEANSSITGISRTFNPAISLNGLFYYMGSSEEAGHEHEDEQEAGAHHHHMEPGIHIQEMELAITANVSPNLRADATISSHGDNLEIENLYVTTMNLPWSLEGRVGKMYVPFGLHNRLHTHMFPFVNPPLIGEAVFGSHGWIDTGASLSWLAPLPWYLNVTVGGYDGAAPFESGGEDDYAGFGRVENLFALGDASTLRLGGSIGWGPAHLEVYDGDTLMGEEEIASRVWGADIQFKWRPPANAQSSALYLQAEYLEQARLKDDDWTDPRQGYYAMAQWQMSRQWWLQGRYDWMETPHELEHDHLEFDHHGHHEDPLAAQRWSYALALVPTHFEAYKLQYEIIDRGGSLEYRTFFQINFTIGSHPAHEY